MARIKIRRTATSIFALPLILSMTACASRPMQAPSMPVAATSNAPASPATASSALDLLVAGIADHRLVLLGEMHGTQEIPVLVGDLVAHYAKSREAVVLALEIDSREQARIDRYVASAGRDADRVALLAGEHWQEPTHDGRDSRAMLALIDRLRALRADGADVAIVCFDRYGEGDRDARMGAALHDAVARMPGTRVIVLTGNVHAMVRAPEDMLMDGKPALLTPTAGHHLVDLQPISINMTALGGASWICQQETCSIQAFTGPVGARAPDFAPDAAPSPWDATLTLPSFTPSPPAVESAATPPAR